MRKAHIVDQERQGDRSRSEWGERGGSNTTKCCRFGDRGVNEDGGKKACGLAVLGGSEESGPASVFPLHSVNSTRALALSLLFISDLHSLARAPRKGLSRDGTAGSFRENSHRFFSLGTSAHRTLFLGKKTVFWTEFGRRNGGSFLTDTN